MAQTNINHKSSCGLFCLWLSYNPGLWTLNQRMRDVGDGAWEQKGFPRPLVFCLENLDAPDLEGEGSAHPEPQWSFACVSAAGVNGLQAASSLLCQTPALVFLEL